MSKCLAWTPTLTCFNDHVTCGCSRLLVYEQSHGQVCASMSSGVRSDAGNQTHVAQRIFAPAFILQRIHTQAVPPPELSWWVSKTPAILSKLGATVRVRRSCLWLEIFTRPLHAKVLGAASTEVRTTSHLPSAYLSCMWLTTPTCGNLNCKQYTYRAHVFLMHSCCTVILSLTSRTDLTHHAWLKNHGAQCSCLAPKLSHFMTQCHMLHLS